MILLKSVFMIQNPIIILISKVKKDKIFERIDCVIHSSKEVLILYAIELFHSNFINPLMLF